MFDIGWGEFVVIGIVALIAIGPKELPGVLRTMGQWVTKIRRMAGEFQGQFQEAMREAEMADLKKDVDEMAAAARGFSNFDPLATVRKEMDGAMTGAASAAATPAVAPDANAAAAPVTAATPANPAAVATPPPAAPLAPFDAEAEGKKPGEGRGA
jgi:sec-independent protein translocase protein TatB